MDTLLKSGYWKIMKLFYIERNLKIHLRDIARKTKLNGNSVSRFLKQLENEEILSFIKEGNLKKYGVKRNKNVYFIFSLFDLERFNKLPDKRKNAIKYFIDCLDEKPVIVILFGSTAKETFTEKSDVDLLLVVNRKIKIESSENYAASQTGIKINCIQIIYNRFIEELKMQTDKVIQSAILSGYPIFNPIHFYEVYYGN